MHDLNQKEIEKICQSKLTNYCGETPWAYLLGYFTEDMIDEVVALIPKGLLVSTEYDTARSEYEGHDIFSIWVMTSREVEDYHSSGGIWGFK